jgi:hypothetical protein
VKFLELDEMLCLLPAEKAVEDKALAKLDRLFNRTADCAGSTERLARLTESGELRTFQVNLAGRPASLIWYRVEQERLVVDTLVSIGSDAALEQSLKATELLARSYHCRVVEGTTARAGLARALNQNGWYPAGVTMRKDL